MESQDPPLVYGWDASAAAVRSLTRAIKIDAPFDAQHSARVFGLQAAGSRFKRQGSDNTRSGGVA